VTDTYFLRLTCPACAGQVFLSEPEGIRRQEHDDREIIMSAQAGIVRWEATMSLDGFIAGPGDAMDWVFRYSEPDAAVEEAIRSTGAVLAGRRSYDVGRRKSSPPEAKQVYGGAWSGPQFVLTRHPPAGETDPSITFLSGDIANAVATAKAAARGKNVLIIGATVARECLEAGLIDEMLIIVAPILLGGGVRLFARPNGKPVDLEKIGVAESGRVTDLRFRVVR
jgi:dihydrofolate reductase